MCSIKGKQLKEEKIEDLLNRDLNICSWIDCLGRLVKIRVLALNEVRDMVQHNINSLTNQTELSRDQLIIRDMNLRVMNSVDIYLNEEGSSNLSEDKKGYLILIIAF